MAWEERREAYFQLLKRVQAKEPNSLKIFDAILAEFDQHPMSRTPMENMDIIGTFYAAKDRDTPEKAVAMVVMNATLGWYDAIRFGSASGRAEIISKEHFFIRAIGMAPPEVRQRYVAFLKGPPERVFAAVQLGQSLAARVKDTDRYDHTWPAAYGSERRAGTPVPPMPAAQWLWAWQHSLEQIQAFYAPQAPPERLQYDPEIRKQSRASPILFHDLVSAPGGVAMVDEVQHPNAARRRIVRIEVATPYDGKQTGVERWTIDHGDGPTSTYTVTLAPDGQGGTNFSVQFPHGK